MGKFGLSLGNPESVLFIFDRDEQAWMNLEADLYWCSTRFLDLSSYIFSEPNLRQGSFVNDMKCISALIDPVLYEHIASTNINFLFFAYRWFVCLLHRELPVRGVFRMWDVSLSVLPATPHFHAHVCSSLLCLLRQDILQSKEFETVLTLLHKPPLSDWGVKKVNELVRHAMGSVKEEKLRIAMLQLLMYMWLGLMAYLHFVVIVVAETVELYGRLLQSLGELEVD